MGRGSRRRTRETETKVLSCEEEEEEEEEGGDGLASNVAGMHVERDARK